MRLALPIRAPIPPPMPLDRKFHGSMPHSRKNAKLCSPLGSPVGGFTFRKKLKTIVKITIEASGFSKDHVQPSTERLYLPRSSRRVRFIISSREDTSSAAFTQCIVVADPL